MAQSRFLGLAATILFAALVQVPAVSGQQSTTVLENGAITAQMAAVLRSITQSAGVIFAGQVVAVRSSAGVEAAGGGIVTIDFRVDEALRGCTSGSMYTLREWATVSNGASERYRVGQRLLMFLHKPNAAGLSSPIHGMEGVVPLRGGGTSPGPFDTWAGTSEWLVDLRWVQAQAMRGQSGQREVRRAQPAAFDRLLSSTLKEEPLVPIDGETAGTPWVQWEPETVRAMLPLSQVLTLCREWMGPPRVDR